MKHSNPDILIYIDKLKRFFDLNEESRSYFINDFDPDLFYKKVIEVSEMNFQETGSPELSPKQFEQIRYELVSSVSDVIEIRAGYYKGFSLN